MTSATKAKTEPLIDEELEQLYALIKDADSVELKLTVPEADHRSTVTQLGMDPLEAQLRQVFFFDTPDLALNEAGVVVRARRIQGKGGDSVVKLRPVVPSELPADLRSSPSMGVEVDAMPGGFVCSASLKAARGNDEVLAVASGERPLRKLFSKEQRKFFSAHAPEGLELDELTLLGPIFVLKLKFRPAELRPQARCRALELPRQLAHPRALDQVRARGGVPGVARQQGLPPGARSRALRRAADEDEDGARVLLEEPVGRNLLAESPTRLGEGGERGVVQGDPISPEGPARLQHRRSERSRQLGGRSPAGRGDLADVDRLELLGLPSARRRRACASRSPRLRSGAAPRS